MSVLDSVFAQNGFRNLAYSCVVYKQYKQRARDASLVMYNIT